MKLIENFIAPDVLSKFPRRVGYMAKPWSVEYTNKTKAWVEQSLFEAKVDLLIFSTNVNLYVAPLGSYDVVLGLTGCEAQG